ncbi:MAG: hypothetical protein DHS20C12_09220 [Pseudohongiella sp.]|nr:MAG: hypothetical protein DHS20C12_09220 [Pseudohongiella sp.]
MKTVNALSRLWVVLLLNAVCISLSLAETHTFEMTVEEVTLQIAPGFSSKVWAYDGQVPGPLIRVTEGDEVELTLINNTTLNHTIHWHGFYQTDSWRSDGVPDITQKAVEPGESFTYKFVADKKGSLWYHCHVNVAEHVGTRGMWGAFIVDPKEPTELEESVTKDAVLMFSGWNPEVADVYGEGGHPTEPISFFSINGKSFPNTQPLRVKEGDVLRVRLFAATIPVAFHLHGHDVLVTHKDGLPLEVPVPMDVVPMQPGERYDLIVHMNNPGRWIAHDHHEHHTTNNGKMPGGAVMVVEYESIENDDWYVWADKDYDPNFYWSETLGTGEPGLFHHDNFMGEFEDFRR